MYRKFLKQEGYTMRAREEGYPARSVYKLKQIDRQEKLFTKGDTVLDLGAAPGSWTMFLSEQVGPKGLVVAVDKAPFKIELRDNMRLLERDVMTFDPKEALREVSSYDHVVSDLAPSTTGVKILDAGRSLELSMRALVIARAVLRQGGSFVCKVFDGGDKHQFIHEVNNSFRVVHLLKPAATRKESKEIYVIGKKFHPRSKRTREGVLG